MKYLLSILLVFSAGNSQSRIGDFQSISSFTHIINALFFDSLLVGVSKSGLIILNTEDDSFNIVSIDNGLSYLNLTHLHKDIKNNLWIGSKKAIQISIRNFNKLLNKDQASRSPTSKDTHKNLQKMCPA